MKTIKILKIILISFAAFVIVIIGFVHFSLKGIPQSHIKANVPDESVFGNYLSRDLSTYFKKKLGKDVAVQYELLRDGPSQSGVAYPKYYAWVSVSSSKDGSLIERGAVYLAAINKEYFQVNDFISEKEIDTNSTTLSQLFPQDVIEKIKNKLQ